MEDKPESWFPTVVSIPFIHPGEDKYTALMVHLRILGAPKHYCALPHAHLVSVLRGIAKNKVAPGPFTGWLETARLRLTCDETKATFSIAKKEQTND